MQGARFNSTAQYVVTHKHVLTHGSPLGHTLNLLKNMLADDLGVARSTFSRLVTGKSDLSPDMAVRLSVVLHSSTESWLRLQESFDLWRARQKVDTQNLNRINFDVEA